MARAVPVRRRLPQSLVSPGVQASATSPDLPVPGKAPVTMPHSEPAAATPEGDVAAALGRIPSGLFVITWRDGHADRAMLASWIMQSGFAPPSVSVAVAPTRDLLAAIDRGITFTVNILGDTQRPLLSRFGKPAGPGEDPFDGLAVERTPGGNARIMESSGWLECRGITRTSAGDHAVVVAEVLSGDPGPAAAPLVHVRKNGLRY